MRILIDECLDWRLCQSLTDHACTSVQRMGWGGVENGELLRKAEQEFDVFITWDRNLAFQQVPENFDIAVIVLHAKSTQLKHTHPLMQRVTQVLPTLRPGEIVDVHLLEYGACGRPIARETGAEGTKQKAAFCLLV